MIDGSTGTTKYELDTPALLADLDAIERNIQTMARFSKEAGINLRPHAKIYKGTPFFARMQIEAGAIGLTVSKLTEAEVLAASGVKSILIANQVIGAVKVRRLVNLSRYTDIIAAVDDYENLRMISDYAVEQGTTVSLLVEADIGNNRCGVSPEDTPAMAQAVVELPGVRFRGLMGYDGHLAFMEDLRAKEEASLACYEKLAVLRDKLTNRGIPVEIVSGGGSCTYRYAAKSGALTELQAGTYIFNDTTYHKIMPEFDCALSIMATVLSRKNRPGFENMAVMNLGRKSIATGYGMPEVKWPEGEIYSMPQEHCRIRLAPESMNVKAGDRVEVLVGDANETYNLYRYVYLTRGDSVVAKLEIAGHGEVT